MYPGKLNEYGSYQYHTIDAFPYFMAGMRGNVSLDPNTTAPEDQIIPQALSSPLRGGDYGPLNGAVITSFTSTGTNAYSLQRQEVVRLIDGMKAEGRCEGVGHGNDSRGAGVASGVYLYRSGCGYTRPLFESQMGYLTFINKLLYEVLFQVKQATHIVCRHTLVFHGSSVLA